MKVLGKLLKLTAAAAVVLSMNACGGSGSESSGNAGWDNVVAGAPEMQEKLAYVPAVTMIPDNAVIAAKIMPEQLFDKIWGQPGSEGYALWEEIVDEQLVELEVEGELGYLCADILQNPAVLGISLDEPVIFSMAADFENIARNKASMDMYLTACLDNKAAFEVQLNKFIACAEEGEIDVKKQVVSSSYTHYELMSNEQSALDLAVMNNLVVLRLTVSTINPVSDLTSSMGSLFADHGPKKTEALLDFYSSKGDIAVWSDLEAVSDILVHVIKAGEPSLVSQLESLLPMYKDASAVADLDFMDGKTVLAVRMYGSEAFKANSLKYNMPASDKFFDQLPASSVFVANLAIKNFSGLVDELCSTDKEIADAMELVELYTGLDEEILKGFPGVMTVAIDGEDIDERDVPGFVLCIECDEIVWKFAEKYLAEEASYIGGDKYRFNGMVDIAYNGEAIIITDVKTGRKMKYADRTFADTPAANVLYNGGMLFDITNLPWGVLNDIVEETGDIMSVSEFLEFFSSATLATSSDLMSSTLTLNMNDKSHNLLEKLILFVIEHPELMEPSYDYDDYNYLFDDYSYLYDDYNYDYDDYYSSDQDDIAALMEEIYSDAVDYEALYDEFEDYYSSDFEDIAAALDGVAGLYDYYDYK